VSTELQAPKLSLREITEQLAAYRDTAEGLIEEDGPDAVLIRAKIAQLESLHTNKVDMRAAFTKWLESEQLGLKADKQRFERRQRAYKRIEDQLYDGARDLMRDNDVTQLKGRAYTITLCDGKKKLDVWDESLIPEQYIAVIPEQVIPERRVVDEEALRSALRDGDVPGARLVDGEQYIQIR
jgi:hypothetical protein